jgi:glucokinase
VSVLAVDLGGTRMRAALVAGDGQVLERVVLPTPRDQPCASAVTDLARRLSVHASPEAAVIGVPGRVLHSAGRLEHAPNLPPGWVVSLTEAALGEALGLPVALANDADLAAVGEHRFGAGRGAHDVVYVTLSTGVGAGAILGGKLVAGQRSGAEIGHVVVDLSAPAGTVEDLASGTAVARAGAAAGLPADAAQVLARVPDDPAAAAVWAGALRAACACVVGLAHLYCPQRLVVGGGLGLHAPGLLEAFRAALDDAGPRGLPEPVEVVAAQLGDDAGLVGAAGWQDARR